MLVKGDFSQAALMLHVVPAGTGTTVFDIDGTLTTEAKLDLFAAYGNATTDIQAYGGAGIAKSRT